MATKITTEKGFKVIKCSIVEIMKLGGIGICDMCDTAPLDGYYIAVLNQWVCEDCYNDWLRRARPYKEDEPIEDKNFKRTWNLLNL